MVLASMLLPALLAAPPELDPRDLLERAANRHYGLQQYRVEVRTSGTAGDRLLPFERVRIAVDESARAFHYELLSGSPAAAVSDGARLWVKGSRGVTEADAEGPDLRGWRQAIETRSGRFAMLGRTDLTAEWVKWETVKRGKARIACGVLRIRPAGAEAGNWSEMLWIAPETGLVWKSVWIERAALPSGGRPASAPVTGEVARSQPMAGWDTIRTREYDWLQTEGDVPPETFAKPAWAARAKGR